MKNHHRAYKFVGEFFIRKHVTGGKNKKYVLLHAIYIRLYTEMAFIRFIFARFVFVFRAIVWNVWIS